PMMLRTSTSHEEGYHWEWAVNTKTLTGDGKGKLNALHNVRLGRKKASETGSMLMQEVPGTEEESTGELACLAAGCAHAQDLGLVWDLELGSNERGNIRTHVYHSVSNGKVCAAGDCGRGQSLVVWAISEGREAARAVDKYLMGESLLEAKSLSMFNPSFAQVS